jgi:hypothetical protein
MSTLLQMNAEVSMRVQTNPCNIAGSLVFVAEQCFFSANSSDSRRLHATLVAPPHNVTKSPPISVKSSTARGLSGLVHTAHLTLSSVAERSAPPPLEGRHVHTRDALSLKGLPSSHCDSDARTWCSRTTHGGVTRGAEAAVHGMVA